MTSSVGHLLFSPLFSIQDSQLPVAWNSWVCSAAGHTWLQQNWLLI